MSEMNKSGTSKKFWTVKTLMQGRRIDNSPVKKISIIEKFLMPTLMEEIHPVA